MELGLKVVALATKRKEKDVPGPGTGVQIMNRSGVFRVFIVAAGYCSSYEAMESISPI